MLYVRRSSRDTHITSILTGATESEVQQTQFNDQKITLKYKNILPGPAAEPSMFKYKPLSTFWIR